MTIARLGKIQKILISLVGIMFLVAFNLLLFAIAIPVMVVLVIVFGIAWVYVWWRYTGISYAKTDDGDLLIRSRWKSYRVPAQDIVWVYDHIPDDAVWYTIVDRYATDDQGKVYFLTRQGTIIVVTPKKNFWFG